MGFAQSKKQVAELDDRKSKSLNRKKEETVSKSDQFANMPSIEQCESTSGSVAALPSTLEIFDKFKSVSENGKDSDSEESFHLPLDDDDMENQSVVSNGRDKEIHNEETEDDILNKFETVPSGTPDPIDPHIEDSILDDAENIADKKIDKPSQSENSALNQDLNDNSNKNEKSTPQIEESAEDRDTCESKGKEETQTKVEVKLTYNFEEYEDSGDGEFKSVYETDELTSESTDKEAPLESSAPSETVEPMEISEEPEFVESVSSKVKKPKSSRKNLQKVVEIMDNFEDSMEVEQEDTNQDIANIIEKLEDHDTPMEGIEAPKTLNEESDVNMTESCEEVALSSKNVLDTEKTSESETERVEETTNDVEMTGDSDTQVNEKFQENIKENVNQTGSNESSEVATIFQEPLEKASKDTTETCPGETQEQIDVNSQPKCSDIEINSSENKENGENQTAIVISEKALEDQPSSSIEENKKSESLVEKDSIDSKNPIESEDQQGKQDGQEFEHICGEEKEDKAIEEIGPNEQKENVDTENVNEDKLTGSKIDDLPNDDLLKELDDTINESDAKDGTTEISKTETQLTKTSKKLENDKEEPETGPSIEEEIFKVPEEVSKISEEPSAQAEEKEGPDLQNEISNDKTDEDESDLLDISMVRETEEDDACAIADAMNDKDAQASEKSDEEQSEKVETEQEGSDVDKDNDNDTEAIDFDDTDEDSHMVSVEQDDSSNAESAKDNVVNICESEGESKKHKKITEPYTDANIDSVVAEITSGESGEETEKMDVPDSLVPETSLNLESTLVQDEADDTTTASEKDTSVVPMPSEDEVEKKKENSKTERAKESPVGDNELNADSLPEQTTEDVSERRKSLLNKRTLSESDTEDPEIAAKKPKLVSTAAADTQSQKERIEKTPVSNKKTVETESAKDAPLVNEKVKTLTGFSKFMQCRKFTAKLSRSDLEQFCIQKICESLMLKSSEGELHQTIKKQEKTIDFMRKDLQQLTKQCKDLEIVNKKLMNELRNLNMQKKPLIPLKITRSVGLQVRLNPGNTEPPNQTRRRQITTTATTTTTTPQKQVVNNANATTTRAKVTTGNAQQPTIVRQVLQSSPQKSPLTTGQTTTNNASPSNPLLSQALQQQKTRQTQAVAAKRTATPVRKASEAAKPANPGVIDLTDEDDKLAGTKTVAGSTIKIVNKAVSPAATTNKTIAVSKMVPGKTAANQGKQVGVQKAVTVGQNKGIRLTPASVISSTANGSPQMVYVVPTITSNSGGTQKVAFVNFQPTNGVLSGALNGSTVSVMSNKGQTLTLKTVPSPMRQKHPAALPAPPRINLDPKLKPLLPKPHLTIKKIDTGIILQWKMPYNLDLYESIASYQLYAYQETSSPPSTDMWRKVGDVKALALPMACTLTQFADKNKYYFAVRSVDVHKRIGAFSDPEEISL